MGFSPCGCLQTNEKYRLSFILFVAKLIHSCYNPLGFGGLRRRISMSGERPPRTIKPYVTVFLLLLVPAATSTAKYSGGTGEPNAPYRIATPNDLNDIGNHIEDFNKSFVMVNDINLAEYSGKQFNIIGYYNDWSDNEPFTGIFDGNGNTISNFTYESNDVNTVGLFGYVDGPNAQITDLTLINPDVNGSACTGYTCATGSLIGFLRDGSIIWCHVDGGRVRGIGYVGGLIGIAGCECFPSAAMVTDSYAGCDVDGEISVGGLVGRNGDTGTVTRCYATGNVSGEDLTGGLVGASSGRISNCYATSDACGVDKTGGLMGIHYIMVMGRVENCFSTGRVSGSQYTGGFAGYIAGASVTKCFWNSEVNPHVNGIGNTTDPNVISKTTAEMMTESTFTDASWDFVEVWDIGEGQTYPFLRVHPAGDMNHDGLVDWRDLAILAGHWLEGAE
jgi:hypothetical protein